MSEHSRKHVAKRHGKHKPSYEGLRKNMKKESVWFYVSIILAALLFISVISSIKKPADMETGTVSVDVDADGTTVNEPIVVDSNAKLSLLDKVKAFFAGKRVSSGSVDVDTSKTGIVTFDLYVMSQCPYGTPAMDAAIGAKKKLGDAMDLNIEYIFYDKAQYAGQESNYCVEDVCSMHGIPEVHGDMYQLCAMDQDKDKAYNMILCMNKDARGMPDNWEKCAEKAGLDTAEIKSCFSDGKALELARTTKKNSEKAGASGSPTIIIDGNRYNGARDELSFTMDVCSKLNNHPACASLPECTTDAHCTAESDKIGTCKNNACVYSDPVSFKMTIISDKICDDCEASVSQNKLALKNLFRGIEFVDYDYTDSDAKELMAKYNVKVLPALIAEEGITKSAPWSNGQINPAAFTKIDDAYVVIPQVIGASFDPTAEICDNGVDDRDQDGLIDCADDECADTIVCRKEIPKELQVFVMSDCPYGKLAINALKEIKDNFGDDFSFEVHYIATESPDGSFNSLHGTYEAEEDMRQLCVKEHNPSEWFDYINCRSTEGIRGNDWNTCADSAGITDKDAIETCVSGNEGTTLLSKDILKAQSLGIGASPTWLANNKYQFGGIAAEDIKTKFCSHNEGMEGCDTTLSGSSNVPSGSC